VCGRKIGKKPGIQVISGLICDDPICNYQPEVSINESRDALIVAGIIEGVPVQQIAFASDMSRQRIYQIFDAWKQGV
jgi:hypothetical protein